MKELVLSQGYVAITDDDFSPSGKYYALVQQTPRGPYVRARRNIRRPDGTRTIIDLHREVWEYHNGPIPEDMTVDHIDHGEFGCLDCRIANLRLATRAEQAQNTRRRTSSSSHFKGVYWAKDRQKWRAEIVANGERINIGSFETEGAAALAYDRVAEELHGDRAVFNFPTLR